MTTENKSNSTKLENINIQQISPLFSPQELKEKLPSSEIARDTVISARNTIQNILQGRDKRILGIVGPCSIHNKSMMLEYCEKFKKLRETVQDVIYLVVRAYFEKPRTTLGWRGLIIDPDLNNSNNISKGLYEGREILLKINELGIPTGTEYLDPVVPNYIDDLVCWASIGARTIESQTHRDMASGVSVPVGFKNSTDGEVVNAVNAMVLSATPRGFIGVDMRGETSIIQTKGNKYTHLILRGGRAGPNYLPHHINQASMVMQSLGQRQNIMVDCSHGNSLKNHKNQRRVLQSIIDQCIVGDTRIVGFMLESNLKEGRQDLIEGKSEELEHGVSITDACISFEETEEIILHSYELLKQHASRFADINYGF